MTSLASPAPQKPRVILVGIDNLNDFIQKDGKLSVPNAIPAANNAATFIEKNIPDINEILDIFDTHREKHIFFPMWWADKDGKHPDPYEDITFEKVSNGTWTPLFRTEWSVAYAKAMSTFKIWPLHCIEGTTGNELFPAIAKANQKFSAFHQKDTKKLIKGLPEGTENYGAFGANVIDPNDPRTWRNLETMRYIASFDKSYWYGEERGHCVRWSLEQFIGFCKEEAPEAISKMRYLTDCISTLEFGDTYKADVNKSIQNMVADGMVVVKSTDPIF